MSQLGIQESQYKSKYPNLDPDEMEMGVDDERDEHHMSQRDAEETAAQHLGQPDQAHYYTGVEKAKKNGMLKDNLPQNLSPTAKRSPVIGLAVRGSSTGGFPSGMDQTGIIPTTPTGRLGGYEPITLNPVNSKLIDKTPSNMEMKSANPINDNPQTTDSITHPFQVQQYNGEPPQEVTGASTDSNTDVPNKDFPNQNVDIDVNDSGNDMDGFENMDQEDKMKAGIPNIEGDRPRQDPDREINETFSRHIQLLRKKLGLISEGSSCKCGDSECNCKCKMTGCNSCGCGKTNTSDAGIGDGQPDPSKWRMNQEDGGMVKKSVRPRFGENKNSGPITKKELDQIWKDVHPEPSVEKEMDTTPYNRRKTSSTYHYNTYEPPSNDLYTGDSSMDTQDNIKLEGKNDNVTPEKMQKALDCLSKQNPDAYAQLLVLPVSFIPSYAWQDLEDEWWSSDEAKTKLQQVEDACQDGPKSDESATLQESKHKKGCKCGFCANKGNFGKKKKVEDDDKDDTEDKKEKLDESYSAPFQRMRGLAGLGQAIVCSNGMWSTNSINENTQTTDKDDNTCGTCKKCKSRGKKLILGMCVACEEQKVRENASDK